jgi:hypothetical protein
MLAWAAGSGSPLAGLERALQGLWAGLPDGFDGFTGADTRIEDTPQIICRQVLAGWVEHDGRHIETTVFSRWRTYLNGNSLHQVWTLMGRSAHEEWCWR